MKTRGDFHFKKFSISHDQSTHKVGTDGVLLGAWVNVGSAKTILDIGTGSGVIALMLAQRTGTDVQIHGVELQGGDAAQARENISKSPWPSKVVITHSSIQDFDPKIHFDLIVSNPPFFVKSWLPPDGKRSKARHANDLPFVELWHAVLRLLKPNGRFAVVLPYSEGNEFIRLGESLNFYPARKLTFQSRPNKPIERLLVEFSQSRHEVKTEELLLYKINEEWTDEYRALTRDFYLKA